MAKSREKLGNTGADVERESKENSGRGAGSEGRGKRRRGRTPSAPNLRAGAKRMARAAATVVTVAAMIICVVMALHIAFVVFAANPDNSIVRVINDWAGWFAWRFKDMFVPKDQRVAVIVNYGIAAIVYLVAGRIAARLIRRAG